MLAHFWPYWPLLAAVGTCLSLVILISPWLLLLAPVGPLCTFWATFGKLWPPFHLGGPCWPFLAPIGPCFPVLAPLVPFWPLFAPLVDFDHFDPLSLLENRIPQLNICSYAQSLCLFILNSGFMKKFKYKHLQLCTIMKHNILLFALQYLPSIWQQIMS